MAKAKAVPYEQAVGAAIKSLREQRRMRQVDLARKATEVGLPLSQTGVVRIESGRNLTLEVITKLAVALNVTPLAFVAPDDVERVDLGDGRGVDSAAACRWWMGMQPLPPQRDKRAYDRLLPDHVQDVHDWIRWDERSKLARDKQAVERAALAPPPPPLDSFGSARRPRGGRS